ncbi:hypothetical protein Poly51_48720 [Rubripirellula tenax]|uniref:Uncharacterized protein n=1 Tax=Rubripirellula tenax TaxID=2528015 RepID=A0A5C6E438_9BACT|nr:hypothetical protein Poly51_62040 [Rubripirellula tenax]TWU48968.1 hypothetical protein Poly51_48720 [Rubripirellula tenax]
MPTRRIMIERLIRVVLATFAVVLFSAAYTRTPLDSLNELFAVVAYLPISLSRDPLLLVPLLVANAALFALVMIAQTKQLYPIFRCYTYAGIAYATGMYLIRTGYNFPVAGLFYGPLFGWLVAVVHNHFGSRICSSLHNRLQRTSPIDSHS